MKLAIYHILILTFLVTLSTRGQSYIDASNAIGIDHYCRDVSMMGGGVAIFDFNNDGFEDIYFTGGLNPDKLYENQGDGTFKDVSEPMGITAINVIYTMGVVTGDVDNDGFKDIFVTTMKGEKLYLLKNEGGIDFNISVNNGTDNDLSWSSSAALADYDLDGDLDLYLGNYVESDPHSFKSGLPPPVKNTLYQNNEEGHFTKVNNPLTEEDKGCTLVTIFSDCDLDGDQDLFVLNDFGSFYKRNQLLINNYPDLSFTEMGEQVSMSAEINSMGVAVGDYDNDGDFDYYITNMAENSLYERQPQLAFMDKAVRKDIIIADKVSWGTGFFDYDNDGYLDLFVANGSLQERYEAQANVLLKGRGDGEFDDVSAVEGIEDLNKARGMAYGDLNNDGKPDMVIANVEGKRSGNRNSVVYINENNQDNNWLKVSLSGTENNKDGYGSIVKVVSGDKSWIREINGGSSYLSNNSSTTHFGLGDIENIDQLIVSWPGKKEEVFTELPVNKHFKVIEDDDIYTYTSRSAKIPEGERIFLEGAFQVNPGIYRDLISHNGQLDEIVVTRLSFEESGNVITGISEHNSQSSEISIFPNPFSNNLKLRLPGLGDFKLNIYDSRGSLKVQMSGRANYGQIQDIEINNTDLPSGMYFIRVEFNDRVYSKNILKM